MSFNTENSFLPLLAKKNVHRIKSRGKVAVLQVVMNANLSLMFDGLMDHAKQIGINVEKLEAGQAIIFVNREGKYIKMLLGTQSKYPVLACYRFPPGMRFPLEAVQSIARSFKASDDISSVDKLRRGLEMHYAKNSNRRRAAGRLHSDNSDKQTEEARVHKAREVSA